MEIKGFILSLVIFIAGILMFFSNIEFNYYLSIAMIIVSVLFMYLFVREGNK